MTASSPHDLTLAEAGAALAAGTATSVGLTRHALDRIAAHTALGAFLHVDEGGALAAAAAADARRAAGQARGPLDGVPIAHKDIFVTTAQPTTAGSKMLTGYQSPFDATVVAQLKAAGAVSVGKLNCDEYA
ncbi:MAG: Asp-tRNA(Asn)/Glu-tRNA(Gln) amidotransferase GatCAB subunit A, partial [Rubrivivax sp.]